MKQGKENSFVNAASSLLLVALALSLTGCGGSESDSARSSPDRTVDTGKNTPVGAGPVLEKNYVSVDEGSETQITGSLNGAILGSYEADSVLEIGVSISADSSGINISTPQVDSPQLSELTLVFEVDGATFEEEVSVHIRNTSADKLEQRVRYIIDDGPSLLALAQDFALYHFSVDFAYLNGLILASEKRDLLDAFKPENSPAYATLKAELSEVKANYSDYEQGLLSDLELEQALGAIDGLARNHGRFGAEKLINVSDFSEVIVPDLVSGSLHLSDSAGFFSRFVGNPEYGSWQEGEFVLNSPYDALSSLIRTNRLQDIRCDAI